MVEFHDMLLQPVSLDAPSGGYSFLELIGTLPVAKGAVVLGGLLYRRAGLVAARSSVCSRHVLDILTTPVP